MFVEILCRTWFTSPLWGLEFWGGERFGKFLYRRVTERQRRNNRSILVQGIIICYCDFSQNNNMLSLITYNHPSSKAVVTGSDHGVSGTTALCKLRAGKIKFYDCGLLRNPHPPHPSLKLHTCWNIEHLHSACVADVASLLGGWVINRPRLSACA